MSNVVDFRAAREEREPHWQGTVKCLGCKHEWQGVAPLGTLIVDCPSCGLPKGHPKHPFGPRPGDAVYACTTCESEAMTLYKRGGRMRVICMGCGVDHTESAFS